MAVEQRKYKSAASLSTTLFRLSYIIRFRAQFGAQNSRRVVKPLPTPVFLKSEFILHLLQLVTVIIGLTTAKQLLN